MAIIDDNRIELALKRRAVGIHELAELQAESERLENMKSSVKSVLMQHSNEKSVAAQEVWAYAHPDYTFHLQTMKDAKQAFLVKKGEMQHESDVIDVWRTLSRNAREGVIT